MCAIFGFVNYGHALSGRHLKELVNKLAVESEVRVTALAPVPASQVFVIFPCELKV